jgi:serine/threonine protein kinase
VKITDFGAASFILDAYQSKRSIIGTPAFVAPETLLREPLDGRADIYALGLILYTAAAGAHPFQCKDRKQILAAQLHKVPEPLVKVRPAFPGLLAEMIHKMCAKLPQERPTAADLLAMLESHREWEKIEDEEPAKNSESSLPAPEARESPVTPPPPQWGTPPLPTPRPDVGGRKSILDAPLLKDTASAKARPKARPVEPEKKSPLLPVVSPAQESPVAKDLLAQADLQYTKKDFQKAEECFRAALRLEPRNRAALLGLARIYTEQLRYKEAVYELYLALATGKVTARAILEMPEFEALKVNEGFRSVIGQFWV